MMDTNNFDPRSVDVATFARRGGCVSGTSALAELARLCDEAHPEARPDAGDELRWQVTGESRAVRGGGAEIWLHLKADAGLALVCQRCLQPVVAGLRVERSFRFVADEHQALAIDADIEEDVLVLSRTFDVIELVEDECLLALPLVPRHEVCPQPLTVAPDPIGLEERKNPFEVLGELKLQRKPSLG
jgi:uncharacterized protein